MSAPEAEDRAEDLLLLSNAALDGFVDLGRELAGKSDRGTQRAAVLVAVAGIHMHACLKSGNEDAIRNSIATFDRMLPLIAAEFALASADASKPAEAT